MVTMPCALPCPPDLLNTINNKVCIEVMQLFLTSDHGRREGRRTNLCIRDHNVRKWSEALNIL